MKTISVHLIILLTTAISYSQSVDLSQFKSLKPRSIGPVSYTHLDVYKRQELVPQGDPMAPAKTRSALSG